MKSYIQLSELGLSKDTELRALKLLKVITKDHGKEIFDFGHKTMRDRWEKLSQIISLSKRFSLQDLFPEYCNFFKNVRGPSPAYAWLKCVRDEDIDCEAVLEAAKIIGREGRKFNAEGCYVRLSLLKSHDDLEADLVAKDSVKTDEIDDREGFAERCLFLIPVMENDSIRS